MGQTLSEPVTTKEISITQSSDFNVASCAMQGWRISMEDSHIHLLKSPVDEDCAFFAVYDGHGVRLFYLKSSQYISNFSGCSRYSFIL
jgi:protein phosphatase 2C family protein 2/3